MPEITHVKGTTLTPGQRFRLPSGADTYNVLSIQMVGSDILRCRVSLGDSLAPLAKPIELGKGDTVILVADA